MTVGGHNIRRTPDREQKRLEQLKKTAQAKRTREQHNLVSDHEQTYQTPQQYQQARHQSKEVYRHQGHLTRTVTERAGIQPAVVLNPPTDSESSSDVEPAIPAPPAFSDDDQSAPPQHHIPTCPMAQPIPSTSTAPPTASTEPHPQPSTSTNPPVTSGIPLGRQIPRTP
jgi:hypothetical protein